MKNIGVIGGGLIGASWAAIFSKSGFNVFVYDTIPVVFDTFNERVKLFLEELKSIDPKINIEDSFNRISINVSIEDLCHNVDYIQESAPEILSVKQELFAKLDQLAPDHVVIASSSSAMPISSITQNLKGQHRCIIAHPANPPHLIPCVEICPGPNTSSITIEKAKTIFDQSGASSVNVKKEIDGFILNRLQGALLNESLRLYSEGYASSDEIDATIRDGLGLRWAFMGPFETIDLNAPGGIRDYMARYGPMYIEMAKTQTKIPDWSDEAGEKLEIERRKILPEDQLQERAKKRNLLLKSLRKIKIENDEE
ncbi:3-hydroxyacyl-CoA dehydrogenase [Alphaproteobacteria bacterium]|jgi:L-gulonate 3-dehydrogenase|nr:3-hydroxyacyl-CoA dehydrogenase [Alphaproteobacteria bacterium]MDC1209432.1 3-hydroxyacyl-CoA dehydrogenase [Pseudomonadota bacterium]|tara:strand:+ start:14826 stop:15758 length:933 start_codon:yes stop_codon:yes gene_type:complete